jgi:hypothetical protein
MSRFCLPLVFGLVSLHHASPYSVRLDKRAARSRAILTFSALVGAMSLARAVSDEALSHEILKTVGGLLKNPAPGHRD